MQLLSESYNPHVRYGAAMALGIACAGTGNKDALALIEPMKNDPVNYVRQVRTTPQTTLRYVYLGKVDSKNQCCGSGSGSTGSTFFGPPGGDPDPDPLSEIWIRIRLRILLSSCKNSKKNLDSYYFVTLFDFLLEK